VRIGDARRELLEELLVDGIEEVLFFGEVTEIGAGVFDGCVVGVELRKELGGGKAP
jgi:hypothetical protein